MKSFLSSRVVACLFSLLSVPATAAAGTVTLAWEPNAESDVAGYVVYYGTSTGQYSTSVDVGRQTWFQFVEPDSSVRYFLAVRAYNTAGAQSGFSQEVSTSPAGTLTLTGVSASATAPQPVGTTITFAATSSGTVVAPQFKWFTSDGSNWTVRQDWSPSNMFAWTPTTANSDAAVAVWARTGTADAPDNSSAAASVNFPVTAQRSTVTVRLTANKRAPKSIGTRVVFTGQASGAATPEFKWWVFDGTAWIVAQEWSANNRLIWTPELANQNYQVIVRARDAANAGESDGASMSFPILDTWFPRGGR
jgi:hypothetical protein